MLQPGETVPLAEVTTLAGETVKLQQPKQLIHLQFRRFAGCPICDMHLQSFVKRSKEIEGQEIAVLIFFHSTAEELQQYESQLPFAVIPDSTEKIYTKFGVTKSFLGFLDPRSLFRAPLVFYKTTVDILAGRRRVPSWMPTGGRFGLPADFLIGEDGQILASKYGVHPNDQWSVDDLLVLGGKQKKEVR